MNWNSIVRTTAAFAMYIALVGGYFAELSPIGFALFSAVVLSVGLCALSFDRHRFNTILPRSPNPVFVSAVPSLTESMNQLRALQTEINELQAQFVNDTNARSRRLTRPGSAS